MQTEIPRLRRCSAGPTREASSCGEANGPRGQDDLPASTLNRSPPLSTSTPVTCLPVNRDAAPVHLDGEVEPMANGIEIGQGRAHADTVGVIHRIGPTHRIRVIHVRVGGKICRQTRLLEGPLRRQPGLGLWRRTGMGPSLP